MTPDYSISVAAVYRLKDDSIVGVEGAGGVSPKDAGELFAKKRPPTHKAGTTVSPTTYLADSS